MSVCDPQHILKTSWNSTKLHRNDHWMVLVPGCQKILFPCRNWDCHGNQRRRKNKIIKSPRVKKILGQFENKFSQLVLGQPSIERVQISLNRQNAWQPPAVLIFPMYVKKYLLVRTTGPVGKLFATNGPWMSIYRFLNIHVYRRKKFFQKLLTRFEYNSA